MKKFILRLLCFFMILLVIAAASIFEFRDTLAKQTYIYAFKAKRERLKELEGNRIVFVGGSSLAYGLDSERIEVVFGRPVVNMGIHAGLGLGFIFSTVVNLIHCDDVVVLAPEYGILSTRSFLYGDITSAEAIVDAAADALNDLHWHAWLYMAEYLPALAANRVNHLSKHIKKSYKKGRKPSSSGAISFRWNKQGDFLNARDKSVVGDLNGRQYIIDPEKIEYLASMRSQLETIGAKVILLPPCLEEGQFDNSGEMLENLEVEFKRVGLSYDAPPERYRMPHDFMYDTVYHLNGEGVKLRTKLVIEDLSRYIMRASGNKEL